MSLQTISNGEQALSIRTKLNECINQINVNTNNITNINQQINDQYYVSDYSVSDGSILTFQKKPKFILITTENSNVGGGGIFRLMNTVGSSLTVYYRSSSSKTYILTGTWTTNTTLTFSGNTSADGNYILFY